MYIFETERLRLRTWKTTDGAPLFKINQDQAVMEKIGLVYQEGQDFKHPLVTTDSPLSHHVLYRKRRFNDGSSSSI